MQIHSCTTQNYLHISAKDPFNFDADPDPGSSLEKMDPEMEFKEFEPRFKFSAGLNLETFATILSGINHI